jgi:hypothetical protein
MYNSRRHLYYPQNYYLGRFLVAFVKRCVRNSATPKIDPPTKPTTGRSRSRWSVILTLILFFFVVPSLPLCLSLVRDYQWERSQPTTIVIPNLIALDQDTAAQRARSAHLDTAVLGKTWYTDVAPGLISLQSPEPGQRVPLGTTIGLELSISPPPVLTGHTK